MKPNPPPALRKPPDFTVSVVEDEPVLRQELAFQLGHLGFAVETFETAAAFYRYLAVRPRTIAVLDIGLPDEDGLSICHHLRQHDSQMGIVFVTARALRDDKLTGLNAGADAYLVKPIDVDELVLILKRLAQRVILPAPPTAAVPTDAPPASSWQLQSASGFLVAPDGKQVRVSASEYKLLRVLLDHTGQVCSHGDLAKALNLLPEEFNKHRVEVIFSRLRERVQRESGYALCIEAERGKGYRLVM